MKVCSQLIFCALLSSISSALFASNGQKSEGYEIANKVIIESTILDEKRDILISLPDGYESSNDTYPVIVLLDGKQNIEHTVASTRMLAKWRGVPECIVVAIPSTLRLRDFTPTKDSSHSNESGGAEKFQQFIEAELMPYIDKTYRTHPFRVLVGHSLSGLFAAKQLLTGNVFYQAYVIISPSLWWQNRVLFNDIEALNERASLLAVPVYFAIGQNDGDGMKKELRDFFKAIKKDDETASDITLHEFDGEGHMSVTLQATYHGISHVFQGAKYSKNSWDDFTSENFTSFLKKTKQTFGSSVTQTGELYMDLAQFLMKSNRYQEAITVLDANIKAYPDYPLNYEWLANVYVLNDQPDMAIKLYKQAANLALSSKSFGSAAHDRYLQEAKRLINPVVVNTDILRLYEGCYISDSGSVFRFQLQHKNLIGSREGWSDFRLFADNESNFYTRVEPRLELMFKDRAVEITAYGASYHLKKGNCF
ncbi:MAG: alpha/beta hydrolase-fold protein [Pseudomonadota bacterium]